MVERGEGGKGGLKGNVWISVYISTQAQNL